jgi:SAM-dependent methyltransferase
MRALYRMVLPCGCRTIFLDDLGGADGSAHLVHQKPMPLLRAYDELFRMVTPPGLTLLEIGVNRGGSLPMWEILGFTGITGLDRAPALTAQFVTHARDHTGAIRVVIEEATNPVALGALQFDVIVDDGSHSFDDVTRILARLWGKLSPGGLYIVEDWYSNDSRPAELIAALTAPMVRTPAKQEPDPDAPYRAFVWKNMVVLEKP